MRLGEGASWRGVVILRTEQTLVAVGFVHGNIRLTASLCAMVWVIIKLTRNVLPAIILCDDEIVQVRKIIRILCHLDVRILCHLGVRISHLHIAWR